MIEHVAGEPLTGDDTARFVRLSQHLLSTIHNSVDVAGAIVDICRTDLDLESLSVCIPLTENRGFHVRAAAGGAPSIDTVRDRDLLEAALSVDGGSYLLAPTTMSETDPSEEFPDGIVDEGPMVLVPLRPDPGESLAVGVPSGVLGVVCASTNGVHGATTVGSLLALAAPLIASAYVGGLDHQLLRLRRLVVDSASFQRGAAELIDEYSAVVRSELGYDAASIWVWDARRSVLTPRFTVRESDSDVGVHHVSPNGPVATLLDRVASRDVIWHDGDPSAELSRLFIEPPEILRNVTLAPIVVPVPAVLEGREQRCLGVVALANKVGSLVDRSCEGCFTWESEMHLRFATEMLSVMVYQLLRQRDLEGDYERQMHAAKNGLLASINHLKLLEALDLSTSIPDEYQYYIPNSCVWLEDLLSQINRNDLVGSADVEPTAIRLYGDVLAPVVAMAHRRARAEGLEKFMVIGEQRLGRNYNEIPDVLADTDAMLAVFRNLVDNSLKYRGDELEAAIAIEVSSGEDYVAISYGDMGVGIPEDEAPHVFDLHYRGERARAIHTQGMGLGLFECQYLLGRMEATIAVLPSRKGAVFEIVLKTAAHADSGRGQELAELKSPREKGRKLS